MTERVEEIRKKWADDLAVLASSDPRLLEDPSWRDIEDIRDLLARLQAVEAENESLLIENDAARKSIGEAWDTAVADGAKIRAVEAERDGWKRRVTMLETDEKWATLKAAEADAQRLTAERDEEQRQCEALMDERERLTAEVARLQEDCDRWHAAWEERRNYAQTLVDRMRALEAELAAERRNVDTAFASAAEFKSRALALEEALTKAHMCPACGETTMAEDAMLVQALKEENERLKAALTPPRRE